MWCHLVLRLTRTRDSDLLRGARISTQVTSSLILCPQQYHMWIDKTTAQHIQSDLQRKVQPLVILPRTPVLVPFGVLIALYQSAIKPP